MANKWNKKICVEYLTQLKSPFDEQTAQQGQPSDPIEKLRQAVQKSKGMMIPEREM